MKILDKYLLKSFTQTFLSVGAILFLIFVIQGVWLFIGDFAGKDIDGFFFVKFFSFYSPIVLPMVLPLSVLLASIMTFGSLSENYEFAAIKSSGISLSRAMKPIIFLIVFISIASFFTANFLIPRSQYEFIKLRKSIAQDKPSMIVTAGQFSKLGNNYIKVKKKYGEYDQLLDDVTIHKVSNNGNGATLVIKAKNGELVSSDNNLNLLQMILYDGYYYEDLVPSDYRKARTVPFAKSSFNKYIINIDLAPFNNVNFDDGDVFSHQMMKISELNTTIDSLEFGRKQELISFAENNHQQVSYAALANAPVYYPPNDSITKKEFNIQKDSLINIFEDSDKVRILKLSTALIESVENNLSNKVFDIEFRTKNINAHWLSIHDKYVIAYSCLLMFFIGAPLGAIIRKGGLGLPIVFAFSIFIIFHFINVFGKKLAQEDGTLPLVGAWMASALLTPFAIILTNKATNDLGVMDFKNVFGSLFVFIKNKFSKNKFSLPNE